MYHPLKYQETLYWEWGRPPVCSTQSVLPSWGVTAGWKVWVLFQRALYTFKHSLSRCPPASPEGPQGRTGHSPAVLTSLVGQSQCQGQARGFGVWKGQSGWKNHPWAPGGQSPQEVGDIGPGQVWGSEGHPWAEAQTCGLSVWKGEAGSRTHQGLISQQLGGHPSTAHSDRTAGCGLGREREARWEARPRSASRCRQDTHTRAPREAGGRDTHTHTLIANTGPTSLT